MRITHVDCFLVTVPAAKPAFSWRAGLAGSGPDSEGGVLLIATDDGHEGVAFTRNGAILADLVDRRLREELIGADPRQREYLWHRMWEIDRIEEMPIYLLGLVDVALWDLAAKAAGEPLWRHLGGYRTEIPAYASTSTFGSTEEYLDIIDQSLALGYPAIKLHAWGDARRDARLCEAVREHVGGCVPLMFDGSAGFDLPDAVLLGKVLSDLDFLWYEEPMREFSIHAYQRLADRVDVPLLLGETSDGAHLNMADFIVSGAATAGVRTSVDLKGGVTGALRVAHLADAFRLRAEVHGPIVPHRHLCMAIPNTTYYESLVTSNPVVREAGIDGRGMVTAPTEPGIGLPAHLDYPRALAAHVK
jgi:L-alanine-DL-glutamate epimerase-like enolase superfamily enzyme